MKRVIRFLARLYPAAWRRRYGAEFDALLEDEPSSWRSLVNVLLGAFRMQLTNWNFVKIVIATAVFGALAGTVGSFAIPKVYQSRAVIRMAGSSDPRVLAEEMIAVQQQTLSRASLTRIMLSLDVDPRGQAPSEIQGTIETMRKHIQVMVSHPSSAFVVAFADPDPSKAAQTPTIPPSSRARLPSATPATPSTSRTAPMPSSTGRASRSASMR